MTYQSPAAIRVRIESIQRVIDRNAADVAVATISPELRGEWLSFRGSWDAWIESSPPLDAGETIETLNEYVRQLRALRSRLSRAGVTIDPGGMPAWTAPDGGELAVEEDRGIGAVCGTGLVLLGLGVAGVAATGAIGRRRR